MMTRMFYLGLVTLLLVPGSLWAGGPPRLCLPIAGVTAENADDCAALIKDALGERIGRVTLRYPDEKQPASPFYAIIPLEKDVSLEDVERALSGSRFSVPRDQLRMFGHVMLVINKGNANAEKITAELKTLPYVSVSETRRHKEQLLVTVDMPYWRTVGDETFCRADFSSDPRTRSEPPASCAQLPNYEQLRDVVARHDAQLIDMRWSAYWGCRLLGAAAAAAAGAAE